MSTFVSKSSLKEELERVPFFSCNQCEKNFVTSEEFRTHMKREHENKLFKKVEFLKKTQSLQETISKQKSKLISSILKLKNEEFIKKPKCNCRGFCFIDHKRYNFQKCEADGRQGPQNGRWGLERGPILGYWALPSTFSK